MLLYRNPAVLRRKAIATLEAFLVTGFIVPIPEDERILFCVWSTRLIPHLKFAAFHRSH